MYLPGMIFFGKLSICFLDVLVAYRKHAWLAIAIGCSASGLLQNFLRLLDIGSLWVPVVYAMASHLMPFVHDALDDFGCMLYKIGGAEESGSHLVLLEAVEDAVGAEF